MRRTVALLSIAMASAVAAQQQDTTLTKRKQPLPTVVVTGTLSNLPPERVGIAMSVIDTLLLRAEPLHSAIDPLRRVTGVYIDEQDGPLGPTIIRLRGGEEQYTRVLVDGVEVNENGGFFDAEGFSLVNIDRLEVARGPQSAVYGSSAMSGVVQLFTPMGNAGETQMSSLVEAGRGARDNVARAEVDGSGGGERARFSFGAGSYYERGPYALPSNLKSTDLSTRVDLMPRATSLVTWTGRFSGVDAKLPVRDPGVDVAPLDPNQKQGRDRVITALTAAWAPSQRWTHRTSLTYYNRQFYYGDMFDGIDESQFNTYVLDANFRYRSVVQRMNARYVGTIAARPADRIGTTWSYGAEYERESLKDAQSGDFGPASQDVSRPSSAAFVEGQVLAGNRVSLLGGTRAEKIQGLKTVMVPRATTVVELVPRRLSLRGGVSNAFKTPNIQDQFPNNPFFVANAALKPETSHSWEVGTDLHSQPLDTRTSLTYFHQRFTNLIRPVTFDSTHAINRNIGATIVSGVEAEVALHPRRSTVGASAAWTSTKILDNSGLSPADYPTGGTLPFRPVYTASTYAELPAKTWLSFFVRASAVGRQTVLAYRFSGPRISLDPYQVLDVTATLRATRYADTYVRVANLLNRRYDVAFDRTGMPRTFVVGLRTHS